MNKTDEKLTPKLIAMNIRRTCGNVLSQTSTSLEKRFKILPIGVTSKNDIASLITDASRIECIPFAAAIVPSENVIETTNWETTVWYVTTRWKKMWMRKNFNDNKLPPNDNRKCVVVDINRMSQEGERE